MLLDYIERLREKPHPVRKRMAFFVASGVTGVVVLAWVFTLPAHIASFSLSGGDLKEKTGMGAFGEAVSKSTNTLQENLGDREEFKQALSAIQEEMAPTIEGGYMISSTTDDGANKAQMEQTQKTPEKPAGVIIEITKTPQVIIATTSAENAR